MKDKMIYVAPNGVRGGFSLLSLALIFIGAGFAWGWPVGLFFLGVVIYVDTLFDNFVERFTSKTNWKQ